jgi:hypothetical protein
MHADPHDPMVHVDGDVRAGERSLTSQCSCASTSSDQLCFAIRACTSSAQAIAETVDENTARASPCSICST